MPAVRRDGLRRHPPVHEHPAEAESGRPDLDFRALRRHPGGRVPGYQLRAVSDSQEAGGRAPEPVRGGGRLPVHLCLPRGQDREHPELQEGFPGGEDLPPGAQLPLHPEHRERGEHADCQQRRPDSETVRVHGR